MKSMTGFGRGEVERDGRKMSIELKSVNHRYLDINLRLPRFLSFLEQPLRKGLKSSLKRGHVDIYINYKNERKDSKSVKADTQLAGAYKNAIDSIGYSLNMKGKLTTLDISKLPDVLVVSDAEEDSDAILALMNDALKLAIENLVSMRVSEGQEMKSDLSEKLVNIEENLLIIKTRSPLVVKEYRDKLLSRISDLMEKVQVDENKLASEVAFFADKASIEEETVRLESHIKQMRNTMELKSAIGRKMDFIVQEMNREVNTICSKSNDLDITNAGLELKSEIEKLREQVQNIE